MSTYDLDFHAWARQQAEAVRQRSANEIDWDNLAEELDGLSKQVLATLRSRYVILLAHLLKWMLQPEYATRSWSSTIREQRLRIADLVEENPSLQPEEAEAFRKAYRIARVRASKETRKPLADFPLEPPFTPEQARDPDWWAGGATPD